MYVQPNTRGMKAILYRDERTYDRMRDWMTKILKDVPVLDEEEGLADEEEEPYVPYQRDSYSAPPQNKKIEHNLGEVTLILKDMASFLTTQDK